MKITKDVVVSIHYTLTDDDGNRLDASAPDQPLAYLHGAGNIIPGLESALEGKQAGDALEVAVEPADAYGERNPELVQAVPRDALANIENLSVGMVLQAQTPQGQVQQLTVEEIGEDSVTLNANHALAGMRLHFEVVVDTVRAATESEVEHQHVH